MSPHPDLPHRTTRPETRARVAARLAELAGRARRSSAPVLAARLSAYARCAQRAVSGGWDGLFAARATLAEDLRRYEAIALRSPLIELTRDALAAVSEAYP